MKKLTCLMFVIAMFACLFQAALPPAAAAEAKPVLTVSFAGYNALFSNLETLGKISGNPAVAQGLEGMITMMTGGKGLAGLDKGAPWGMVIQADEQGNFPMIGFLPLSDVKQQLDVLQMQPGISVQEQDGVFEITPPNGPKVVVAQRGTWAYIAREKAHLDNFSSDPDKMLGELPGQYLVACRADVKNMPSSLRKQFLMPIKMGMQMGGPNPTAQKSLEQLEMLLGELDQVLLGLNVDGQTNTVSVDLEVTAQSGTDLARRMAQMTKPAPTDFAGFDLPGAALTAHWAGTLTDDDVANNKATLETYRSKIAEELDNQGLPAEKVQLAQKLLDDVFDVIVQTLELKKSNGGAVLRADGSTFFFAAGSVIADGKKLEAVVKELVDAAGQDEPQVAEMVRLDAETHQGVRFHVVTMPVPQENFRPLVGDTLEMVLGVGDSQVFLAAGRDAVKTLKEIIDQSQAQAGKEISPFTLKLAVTPLAQFISAVAEEEGVKATAQMIASMTEQSSGKDHVTLSLKATANGFRLRLEAEEGVIKALGIMGPMLSPVPVMPMPPGGGSPFE